MLEKENIKTADKATTACVATPSKDDCRIARFNSRRGKIHEGRIKKSWYPTWVDFDGFPDRHDRGTERPRLTSPGVENELQYFAV